MHQTSKAPPATKQPPGSKTFNGSEGTPYASGAICVIAGYGGDGFDDEAGLAQSQAWGPGVFDHEGEACHV